MNLAESGQDRARPLSVGGLVNTACSALDYGVGEVWVEGEIFEYRGPHHSGHYYFSLRDAEASVPAIVWRGVAARALRCELREGARVLVHGHFEIWSKTGKLSLLLDFIEDRGAGDLARRFEELKRRLQAEGLFAPARKRLLPAMPRTVVLITGRGSAAEADVLSTLESSRAPLRVLVRHARVQGAGAAEDLAQALAEAASVRPDVVLLARGGGSLDDLWAFNEEVLVRAVAECPVPVLSAIGHETDFTLCDFAADLRAITPTDGARILCQGWRAASAQLAQVGAALQRAGQELLRARRTRVDRALRELLRQAPQRRLDRARFAVGELHRRMLEAGAAGPAQARTRALRCARRLERHDPAARHALWRARLTSLGERLVSASPESLLARGWALVEARGQPGFLRRAADVQPGDRLRIRLAEGELGARVE